MKPTENRALAEQRALAARVRLWRDGLLMREAIASVALSRVEDGTNDREDESEEPHDGR